MSKLEDGLRSSSSHTNHASAPAIIITPKSVNDEENPYTFGRRSFEYPRPPLPPAKKEKKMHWPSLITVMILGFLANVEYGIIMPSIYKYLVKVNGNATQLGYALALNSLSSLVCLPIFGWWSDKRTMKEVFIVSLVIGIIGNFVYATAEVAVSPWLVITGRIIVGIYSAASSVTNSYIAAVTKASERTTYMAYINGINAVGLVSGPAFNLFLGHTVVISGKWQADQFTWPGYFLIILLAISIPPFIFIFREPLTAEQKAHKLNKKIKTKGQDEWREYGKFMVDSLTNPIGVCFLITFVQNFNFSILETVATVISSDQFGFHSFANSVMYSIISIQMIIIILVCAIFNERLSDRWIMLFGLTCMGIGSLVGLFFFHGLKLWMFVIVTGIIILGLPSTNTAVMGLFSKLITVRYPNSPKQGIYQGVMMVFGAAARILGPLWGSYAVPSDPDPNVVVDPSRQNYRLLFGFIVAMLAPVLLVTVIFFKKLNIDPALLRVSSPPLKGEKTPLMEHASARY
eukprot:TRINITY_DN7891_c0_g1_i1.p1 TRINITY_DN7891_c0_g1~~TRINITY_DN7891_c0_g1_i1.p1  ORF type:complete len:516 (-),score=115.08 TRINITY_DN7891_c0_g1_i1:18-1565(-)